MDVIQEPRGENQAVESRQDRLRSSSFCWNAGVAERAGFVNQRTDIVPRVFESHF